MKYRKFGKTGIDVSALGFGLMRLPVIDKDNSKIDEVKAAEMVRYAIDNGVNYFDTAFPYHAADFTKGGSSEPFLGKVLKEINRKDIYIATKLPSWIISSRADMDRLLDQQLERLNTDYIDFYLLHGLNRNMWKNLQDNNALEFLDKALDSGRIKFAGFSFHDDISVFKEITDAYEWKFCQIQYNYFDQDFQAGREGLNYASERDIAVVVMEPLRGGALVNRLPFEVRQLMKSSGNGWSNVEWAMRWIWSHSDVATILSGMSDIGQLRENIALAGEVSEEFLTEKDSKIIEEAKKMLEDLQKVSCTTCGYCTPCPEGVDIPRNFSLFNDHHMFRDPAAVMRYRTFLSDQGKASNCIQCGLCLEKCPQQIAIPEELEKVAELFK